MLIEIRHTNGILLEELHASHFQWATELKNDLKYLLDAVEDQESTFVHFDNQFITQGFVDESLDGLPIKGNIDTLVNAITQEAVDFFNLDDEDKIHYENARELDILKETVGETVEHMQCRYLGEYDDLESYIREDLDDKYNIPLFIMEAVDMDRICSAYESAHDYTFINSHLYADVEDQSHSPAIAGEPLIKKNRKTP